MNTDVTTPDDLRQLVALGMPQTIADLERLVRIPSVGHAGHDRRHVRESAEATEGILRDAGATTQLIELAGGEGHPAVYGEIAGPADGPAVLLYAHHDVQPEGPADRWQTPPFEPDIRGGRLYGRGAADDKSGIVTHAAALRALSASSGGSPPVTIKILVEGEEECSTEHLPELIEGNADLLRSDVALIADGGNYRTGVPTIGTSIRGITDCIVTVKVLPIAQHSGTYGGAIPDAVTALARMIATLHDDAGDVAIEGLRSFEWPGTQIPERELREESRVLDSVQMMGTGTLADRVLSRPAIAVIGFDAPRIQGSSNQIVPEARAKISLRLAPGDDPVHARDVLANHLMGAAPWGVQVDIRADEVGEGYMVDTASPSYALAKRALAEAFGADVMEVGSGGSIPLVPMLAKTLPGIDVLIVGASDERSNVHSLDESVDLRDLERMVLAEALFIRDLAI